MKTRKPREENLSSGTIDEKKEKKQTKKNRLAGMLEAMEKRSDPITTHKLATEYFKSFREIRNLSPSPTSKRENKEEESNQPNAELTTPVETPVVTPAMTPVITTIRTPVETPIIETGTTRRATKKDEVLEPLDTTHSSSESRIYSVMYRETISKGTDKQYFGTKRLMTLTGIRGDHTIRRAIDGLIAKKSIEIIDINFAHPIGPKYRVYAPKDIFQRRREAGIEIDAQTKKITTPVATPVNLTGVTPVKTTPVTPVKMTGVQATTPYIEKNNKNIDIESSSRITDDESFNHKTYISSLYKKYTGNDWRKGEEDFYNRVKDILPDIIEASLIATALRGNTISSFAECKGIIQEFQVKLPPGYLGYLRTQWNKANITRESEEVHHHHTTLEGKKGRTGALSVPEGSFFESPWLESYLSNFSGEERQRIKRLAEKFDYFMLTSGKRRDWVKNPTGFFVQLVKGEVNVKLSEEAPTFEERLEKEARIKLDEEKEHKRDEIVEQIIKAICLLDAEQKAKILSAARKRYKIQRGQRDEFVMENLPYNIVFELEETGKQDWRDIWDEINESHYGKLEPES